MLASRFTTVVDRQSSGKSRIILARKFTMAVNRQSSGKCRLKEATS